jgi:3-hydroxyisobutyrate dehydrogenase-like beta-hydroxyacid dehydrogenase
MLERVGFIGLGNIGEPMAANLVGTFPEVVVHDLRTDAVEKLVELGAKAAASSREVGERCEVVGVCVVDDADTEAVVAGEDGVLAGARPGTVIALHSTIHPDTARGLAERATVAGCHVVDAQMTGGAARTVERKLRFMVGGDEEALARCRPFLEASGDEIIHCGAVGNGAVAKLCNNLVQYQAWQAYVDAERLAEGAGLSRETLHDVLSWIMNDNARVMLAGRKALEQDPGNRMLLDRFVPVMHLAEKDLSLALDVARKVGVALPGTGLCSQQMARVYGVPDPRRR